MSTLTGRSSKVPVNNDSDGPLKAQTIPPTVTLVDARVDSPFTEAAKSSVYLTADGASSMKLGSQLAADHLADGRSAIIADDSHDIPSHSAVEPGAPGQAIPNTPETYNTALLSPLSSSNRFSPGYTTNNEEYPGRRSYAHEPAPLPPHEYFQRPTCKDDVQPENPTTPMNQQTGWAAVEKALTEFDKQEVGNCKEDIDSLLVFAGLYSAILTAFVIVSYPQLQEDTASATLQVLRVIANQSFTIEGPVARPINIDTAPTSQFQPSPTAIRVNVLWFASLVISLSTASFAIIVKQWLRAYMAFATASPQGQLRVRQFRRRGLEAWRVFGIASLLPLCLQISLILFFVGLCYFTVDIHPALGNVTLPLVSAWAFLFIAVTLSPIASSNCPYKTPAFTQATTAFRTHVLPHVVPFSLFAIVCVVMSPSVIISIPLWWACRIIEAVFHLRSPFFIPKDVKWLLEMYHYQPGPLHERPPKEVEIIKDSSKDLDILVSADELQADDRLLDPTMKVALEQSNPSWEASVEFLVRIIGNRVPLTGSRDPLSSEASFIDNSTVSAGAWKAIVSIYYSQVIDKALQDDDDEPRPWSRQSRSFRAATKWAVYILLAAYEEGVQIPRKFRLCVDEIVRGSRYISIGFGSGGNSSQSMFNLACIGLRTRSYTNWRRSDSAVQQQCLRILYSQLEWLREHNRQQLFKEVVGDLNKELRSSLDEYNESTSLRAPDAELPLNNPTLHLVHANTCAIISAAIHTQIMLCHGDVLHSLPVAVVDAIQTLAKNWSLMPSWSLSVDIRSHLLSFLPQLQGSDLSLIAAYARYLIARQDGNVSESTYLSDVISDIAYNTYTKIVDSGEEYTIDDNLQRLIYLALCLAREEKALSNETWTRTVHAWRSVFGLLAQVLAKSSFPQFFIGPMYRFSQSYWTAVDDASRQDIESGDFYEKQALVPDYFCLMLGAKVGWPNCGECWRGSYLQELPQEVRGTLEAEGKLEAEEAKRLHLASRVVWRGEEADLSPSSDSELDTESYNFAFHSEIPYIPMGSRSSLDTTITPVPAPLPPTLSWSTQSGIRSRSRSPPRALIPLHMMSRSSFDTTIILPPLPYHTVRPPTASWLTQSGTRSRSRSPPQVLTPPHMSNSRESVQARLAMLASRSGIPAWTVGRTQRTGRERSSVGAYSTPSHTTDSPSVAKVERGVQAEAGVEVEGQ